MGLLGDTFTEEVRCQCTFNGFSRYAYYLLLLPQNASSRNTICDPCFLWLPHPNPHPTRFASSIRVANAAMRYLCTEKTRALPPCDGAGLFWARAALHTGLVGRRCSRQPASLPFRLLCTICEVTALWPAGGLKLSTATP